MNIDIPNFNNLFFRSYIQQTTIVTKETYAHKVKRLIYEQFGKDADATWELVQKESGGRWDAVNPVSGAAGIGQAWPRSKMPCGLTEKDIECQISWLKTYITNRYVNGSIALENWIMNQRMFGEGSY